jgi:hypothetical protein
LQVLDAADVGRDDRLRLQRAQVPQLAIAQRVRDVGLQHRIGARRAAAQVRFVQRHAHVEAERACALDAAAQLLPVLQRARRMVGEQPRARAPCLAARGTMVGQQLAQVAREFADAPRLLRVGRVVLQVWPYSRTVTPQPEAFITIASTSPRST